MSINVRKSGLIDAALHRKGVPAKTYCSRIGGQLTLSSTTCKQQLTVMTDVLPQAKVNDLIIN